MRPAPDDPSALSLHKRLRELTAILANGVHRLRAITPAPPECGQIPAESSQTGLDPGAQTSPSVSTLIRNNPACAGYRLESRPRKVTSTNLELLRPAAP